MARQLVGVRIVAAGGAPIGEVSDLLCDTREDRIAALVVSRGGAEFAIPWTSPAAAQPITVSPAALAQSTPVPDALNANPGLRAVQHDLVGRSLMSADGTPAGRIVGLQIDPQNGTVTDLLIAAATGETARELPWSAIADIDLSPIVLDLNAQQVAALPTAGARMASN